MNIHKFISFSIGPIVAAALSFVTIPFVAWFFSTEDVGRLTMLQAVTTLSVSFFSLSMHQAYVREYNEVVDKSLLFKLSITPGLILLILTSLIIVFLPYSISEFLFGINSSFLVFLLVLSIYSGFFINFFSHVIRMEERGLVFSATQIAPKAFLLIFICFLIIFNIDESFNVLMAMSTLSIFISAVVFSYFTINTWHKSLNEKLNFATLRQMLTFSLPLVAGSLAYWGLTTMDRFFLRSLVGFNELGVYALAVSLASAVSVISSLFTNLWHPILYKWVKEGLNINKIQSVSEVMIVFISFVWSLVALFSYVLNFLLPSEYDAVRYLIIPCVAMPLFVLLSETTSVGIGISRKSLYSMFASILAFLTNAILNYFFIPNYGAAGASLATLIAFFVFFIFKTESSSKLWVSLPRLKIYAICLAYSIATIIFVLNKGEIKGYYIVWILLLFTTCLLYRRRLEEIIKHKRL
jgi:O-antigen/teichoic acid export membrane protein